MRDKAVPTGFPHAPWRVITSILAILVSFLSLFPAASKAQTPPITPSGGLQTQISGPISVNGQIQYDITGGTRPGGGANLFHSFGDFGVPANNIANFLNETAQPTSNILARVTGGNVSNIFGTIQTTEFGNANLFLMNPAGFLFGPNATVNVGGLVAFTSADYLKLTDNVRFNATPNAAADALLTALPVASFGFLGSNPGAITIRGSQFTVADGQSISLVGGNISIESGTPEGGTVQPALLSAPNGNILLASAASPGEFDAATLQSLPNVDDASFTSFGSVTLAAGSTVAVSGTNSVSIRGGQFVLSVNDAVMTTSESAPVAETVSLSPGSMVTTANAGSDAEVADVEIVTGNVDIDGATINSVTTGDGRGGHISVIANKLEILNGGHIISTSGVMDSETGDVIGGAGQGGDITITANQSVRVSEQSGFSSSSIESLSHLSGNGGNIIVDAPAVAIENGGLLLSRSVGEGAAGTISIIAPDSLLVRGFQDVSIPGVPFDFRLHSSVISDTQGTGEGGAVSVMAGSLTIAEEGRIQTVTSGDGLAGSITVHANNSINLSGGGFIESLGTGTNATGAVTVTATTTLTIKGADQFDSVNQSRISNDQQGDAANGGLTIHAHDIVLKEGGRIRNDSLLQGSLTKITADNSITIESGGRIASRADLEAIGPIELHAPAITLDQGSVTARTITTATGGAILLDGQVITLRNGSELASATEGSSGGGGPITVLASDSILVSGGSSIQSISFADGPAGDINLNATNSITLSGSGTTVSTQTVGTGAGGAITLQAQNTSVTDGAVVTATSTGSGAAGSVTIEGNSPAQSILIDGIGSGIFTSTEGTGAGGSIFVNANTATLTNGATVSASSTGQIENPGNAGNIDITATNGLTMQNSTITTQAGQGASGGDIKVTTSPEAMVWLQNSTISASVADGPGGGGDIEIDPQFVILQNSQILARAAQGQGGAITITTNLFLPDANSVVNADAGSGLNGTVTIQSPNAPASGKIQPLGQSPLLATSLLNQRCAALAGGEFSSFTVAGRDSLPTEPGGWLSSPLYAAGVGLGVKAEGGKAEGEGLEGAAPILSLRQIAPAGFLTQSFAVDRSASCQS